MALDVLDISDTVLRYDSMGSVLSPNSFRSSAELSIMSLRFINTSSPTESLGDVGDFKLNFLFVSKPSMAFLIATAGGKPFDKAGRFIESLTMPCASLRS